MDSVLGQVGTYLVSLGLPGIIILALGAALWRKDQQLTDVNEKRIAEAMALVKASEGLTNAFNNLSAVVAAKRSD